MDRKLKRKLILLRNKKNQRIFQHAREHKAEHDRIVDDEQERLNAGPPEKTKKQKEDDKEVWSEKVQKIRNKMTNKKRKAKDRWNRFSGTEGGGARGR